VLIGNWTAQIGSEYSVGSAYLYDAMSGELLATLLPQELSAFGDSVGYGTALDGDTLLISSNRDGGQVYLLAPALNPDGDFNHDGAVDAVDYVVWRKTDGMAAGYNAWRSHFGQPPGGGTGAMANVAVPEPATGMLLMFAAAGWCFRRGRAA
jgi:hypothetical protein